MVEAGSIAELVASLTTCLGPDRVVTDPSQRRLLGTDFLREGELCAAAIRPADAETLSRAAAVVTGAGYALIPRGGGISYTGGYTPDTEASVIVDLRDLNRIIDVHPGDMTVTVEAGVTWEAIYKVLKPHGVRLPFFGTFSGRLATVGGGLSNGAVFFGTARYGSAADNTLGLKVVTASGQILRTGQAAIRHGKPFFRTHGPDLTGLFLHDAGALGIKTQATLRLIQAPAAEDYISWAFADAETTAGALSAIGRSGAVEEAYVFDPETTARNLEQGDLKSDLQTLGRIVTGQETFAKGLKAGARVAMAGKDLVPEGAYSLHLTCAGRTEVAVQEDTAICRSILTEAGGQEMPNSIPLAARASPFSNLNAVLGPEGERWVALNAKVPHSDAESMIRGFQRIVDQARAHMDDLGVTVSVLFIAMDTHAFSFEPVFHWKDSWLAPHRTVPDANHLAALTEPPPNSEATALVNELREQTLNLFTELGAVSNQIGRTYEYRQRLAPETRQLLDALKAELDPNGLMNPGVLGY